MIAKTKTEYHVTLAEAKRHLRGLDNEFNEEDEYLRDTIKAAVEMAEGEIGKDIATTTNVLTLNEFTGGEVKVNEGNLISITSITDDGAALSDFTTYVYRDYFRVELDTDVDSDQLVATFQTGYDKGKLPFAIKHAILIKVGDLYDVERSSRIIGSIFADSGAFERYLAPFKSMVSTYNREA